MILLLIYTCWLLFSPHPCFMWHFLHSYLSLLYRWIQQRRGDRTLELVAEGTSTHRMWVSSSPAQCLRRAFSSEQQQVVYNYTKRLFIYDNYYQECIGKKPPTNYEMKKIARLHFPAKIKAAFGSDFGLLISCTPICFFPGGKGKLRPCWDVIRICWDGVLWTPEERTSRRRDAHTGCHGRWRWKGEDGAHSLQASELVRA